jgi:hypothetical protein
MPRLPRSLLAVLLLCGAPPLAQSPGDAVNPPGAPPLDAPTPDAPSANPPDERMRPPRPEEKPGPPPSTYGGRRGAVLEELNGSVRAVDLKAHRMTLDVAGRSVTIALDRNTLVYLPAGLGTIMDVRPGTQIRAARNADSLAYWVQVRGAARAGTPESTPAQGSGPGGGGPPPAEGGGAGAAPPKVGPGSASPGSTPQP